MLRTLMTVAARSDVGRRRTNNEDAFAVADLGTGVVVSCDEDETDLDVGKDWVLLSLSDGMGGHQAGEVASSLVLESLRESVRSATGDSISSRLEAAVHRANADVVRVAQESNKRGMGATLTAVMVCRDEAYVAEVGDSRAYLLRAGQIRQITRDQSLVQMLIDSGVMSAEEARRSPQKNIILQAVGLDELVRVAIGKAILRRGDQLLLCSDGISNAISDLELRDVLINSRPKAACDKLIALANERGGEDNLTVVVARLFGDGYVEPQVGESVTSTFQVIQELHDPIAPKSRREQK